LLFFLVSARSVASHLNQLISRNWFILDIKLSAFTAFLYTFGWILQAFILPVNTTNKVVSKVIILLVAVVHALR
jgi:hypothetical protein